MIVFDKIMNCIDHFRYLKVVVVKVVLNKTFQNIFGFIAWSWFCDIFAYTERFSSKQK